MIKIVSFILNLIKFLGVSMLSWRPVLVVQTNGKDFFLYLLCRQNADVETSQARQDIDVRVIYQYQANYTEAITLIYKWLNKIHFILFNNDKSKAELHANAINSIQGVFGIDLF